MVIGAAKSGTTSLHEYLAQHPDIFMSPVKEPNYFAFAGTAPDFRGPDDDGLPCRASADVLRVAKYAGSVWRRDDYQRLFAKAGSRKAVGESSVSYMYFPEAVERLHAELPDVKLIAILRNPAERAYSKFIQFLRDGCEPLEDFESALGAEEDRVARNWSATWFYRRRGYYHAQLRRFFDRFDPRRIRVVLHEDLKSHPQHLLADIFRFLGVDDQFVANTTRRHNVSSAPQRVPRYDLPERLVTPAAGAALRRVLPSRGVNVFQRGVRHLNSRYSPWEPPPFAPEVRARLVDGYRDDIRALETLIGRDLSSWLR